MRPFLLRSLLVLLGLSWGTGALRPCVAADAPPRRGPSAADMVRDLAAADAYDRAMAARQRLSFLLEELDLESALRQSIADGLIAASADAGEDVRQAAIDALQLGGRSAPATAAALVARLSDASSIVQMSAVKALVHVPWPDAKPVVALLARLEAPPRRTETR